MVHFDLILRREFSQVFIVSFCWRKDVGMSFIKISVKHHWKGTFYESNTVLLRCLAFIDRIKGCAQLITHTNTFKFHIQVLYFSVLWNQLLCDLIYVIRLNYFVITRHRISFNKLRTIDHSHSHYLSRTHHFSQILINLNFGASLERMVFKVASLLLIWDVFLRSIVFELTDIVIPIFHIYFNN